MFNVSHAAQCKTCVYPFAVFRLSLFLYTCRRRIAKKIVSLCVKCFEVNNYISLEIQDLLIEFSIFFVRKNETHSRTHKTFLYTEVFILRKRKKEKKNCIFVLLIGISREHDLYEYSFFNRNVTVFIFYFSVPNKLFFPSEWLLFTNKYLFIRQKKTV